MATHKILDLPQPTLNQEAATKKYVDDVPLPEHGADKHTNVTRELFIPACQGFARAGTPDYDQYAYYSLVVGAANLDEPDVYFTIKVPDDFVSFLSVKAVWLSLTDVAGKVMYWHLSAGYAASGEENDTHVDEPALGVTPTGLAYILNVQEPANPLTLPGLAEGDYLGLDFYREGSSELDTLNVPAWLFGLLFTYTAEQ